MSFFLFFWLVGFGEVRIELYKTGLQMRWSRVLSELEIAATIVCHWNPGPFLSSLTYYVLRLRSALPSFLVPISNQVIKSNFFYSLHLILLLHYQTLSPFLFFSFVRSQLLLILYELGFLQFRAVIQIQQFLFSTNNINYLISYSTSGLISYFSIFSF